MKNIIQSLHDFKMACYGSIGHDGIVEIVVDTTLFKFLVDLSNSNVEDRKMSFDDFEAYRKFIEKGELIVDGVRFRRKSVDLEPPKSQSVVDVFYPDGDRP